jgi:bacterioferritin
MKQNEKLIMVLNQILNDELKATNQIMQNPKVSDDLDYGELYEEIEKETTEELKQAEWLIRRIIFLEVLRTRQQLLNINKNNTEDSYINIKNVG